MVLEVVVGEPLVQLLGPQLVQRSRSTSAGPNEGAVIHDDLNSVSDVPPRL